ncbi:MAG: hypothetical protein NT084_10255 [Bacteroidetes bacterium]|nr:hypothetical protein [Bacteroidota bacterium]
MRNIFFTLFLSVIFTSCNQNKIADQKTDAVKSDSIPKKDSVITPQIQNRTADQTVKDFLCWYNDNYEKVNKIEMIKNNPPTEDTTKYYAVNFAGTEQWLKLFQESGFVSDVFLTHWRNYFKECEKAFQKDHESDGPPMGFEYDFIFQSQEQTPNNSEIQQAAFTQNSNGDKTTIVLNFPKYGSYTKILVKSADGKWLLAE